MDLVWVFFAMPFLALVCAAYIIVRGKRPRPLDCVTALPKSSLQRTSEKKSFLEQNVGSHGSL
jgi:hypothetical protein